MSGSSVVRVPRPCDENCDYENDGRRCPGGHYVEVNYEGASDTTVVRLGRGYERLVFSREEWLALLRAAVLVSPQRAELDEVTAEALMAVVLDPDSVGAEYRSRHTGEILGG